MGGPEKVRAPRDPRLFQVYAVAVILAVVVLAVQGFAGGSFATLSVAAVATWLLLCCAANVLAAPAAQNVYLSMSSPINVAIAWLFGPAGAAVVVAVGSLSEWELKRDTTPFHALFNRAQLGLSAAAASATMAVPAGGVSSVSRALAGVVVYQVTNWLLVGLAERTSRRTPVLVLIGRLLPAGPVAAVVYFTLGAMGIALALTYERVGAWAVALLMLPILGARHAVKASSDLERAERAQAALSERLVDEAERERVRVASDIHDVVLQDLAALQLQTDSIQSALSAGRAETATTLARQANAAAARAIQDLRASVASLRRVSLDDAGLAESLRRYARSFHNETGIVVDVRVDVGDASLATPTALLLYETCQEALTNVAAHADADHVEVALGNEGGMWELRVSDDGRGLPADAGSVAGIGLSLVREKIALAGGGFWTARRAGGGTELIVRVPRRAERL